MTDPTAKPERLILFVCTGNTCRSPMAEALARDVLGREIKPRTKVRVASAGVNAYAGDPMTPEAASALEALGVDPGRHVSRALTLEMLQAAEAVFVMTRSHNRSAAAIAPEQAHKIQLLDTEGNDITDPIGGEEDVYVATARRLHDLVRARLRALLAETPART